MPWHAQLQLHYQNDHGRTRLMHEHTGPLRILKSLYPEGDAVCHNVIVHPPGGLVGGDALEVQVRVDAGAHGLISTPGATRFYASENEAPTRQSISLSLAPGARLEWLPLESIAYPGCQAHNHLQAHLGEDAELMAWDVVALGLPSAGEAFTQGCFRQHLEIPGLWLEQARIDASDSRLLDSPLGLDGLRCLGTLWLACGSAIARERRETLLDGVRSTFASLPSEVRIGATCPNTQTLVVRAAAPLVEPLMHSLQTVWSKLRPLAWNLPGNKPRIWGV